MSALPKQQSLPFAENGLWLDTKQVAERLCICERAAVNLATKHAASGMARLESPPEGGKPKWYVHITADRRLRQAPSPQDAAQREALLRRFPEKSVHGAYLKFRWLTEWERACQRGSRGETERSIAERIVREARRVEGDDLKITGRTLRNWRKQFNAIGPDGRRMGIEGLVDRRECGRSITANGESATRSPEAIAFFNDLYRTNGCPTLKTCHDVTRYEARKHGWAWPETYASAVKWHKDHDDIALTLLLREGRDGWSRKYLPHCEIDYSTLEPGEMYVADHHQCDFWVTKGRAQIRPWLTAVQDLRSRCIVGWHLGEAPHQDAIVAALRMAFREWSIPKHMKLDNGKDFKSKLLTGLTSTERARLKAEHGPDWRKVEARDANLVTCDDTLWSGIIGELGIETHFAIPYSPWSKGTLERWFGTFESQLGKTMPTYCGNNVLKKPECLDAIRRGYTSEQKKYNLKKYGRDWWKQVVLKFVDEAHVPTLQEAREDVGAFIEIYHRETHHFDHMDGVIPLATWATAKTIRKAGENELLLLMESRGVYKVTGNGVGFKVGAGWHSYGDRCPLLKRFVGREVFITIDPDNISNCTAWTADEKGRRFIARLESNERIPPHTPIDAEREVIARKKREQSVMHKASRSGARRWLSTSERLRAYQREKLQQLKKTGTYDSTADIAIVRTGFEGSSKPVQDAPVSTPDGYVPFDVSELDRIPEHLHSTDEFEDMFVSDEELEKIKAPSKSISGFRSFDDEDEDERPPLTLDDLKMTWQRTAEDSGLKMPWERTAEDSGTEAHSDESEQAP
ncbi:MAG: DDE-type integrase/transposase/recombinase [Planctomycetota bacterium]